MIGATMSEFNERDSKIVNKVLKDFSYEKDGKMVIDQPVISAAIAAYKAARDFSEISEMPIWHTGKPECEGLYLVRLRYDNRRIGGFSSAYTILRYKDLYGRMLWYEEDWECVSVVDQWILLEKDHDNGNKFK